MKEPTLRQMEIIACIYWRKENFGIVKFKDLVGDIGISFATLADHLKALIKKGFIEQTSKEPRNLNFNDEIELTVDGEKFISELFKKIDISKNMTTLQIIHKIKEYMSITYPSRPKKMGFYDKNATLSKVLDELMAKNPVEPIITSIVMYTELDGNLDIIAQTSKDTYINISRAKLNLEIRNGRIASIAIPVALRGELLHKNLMNILGKSWSWTSFVAKKSINRYLEEAISLGLISRVGYGYRSMYSDSTDIIRWLASKTSSTFLNAFPSSPKVALLLFRESFKMPTIEEIFNPYLNDSLVWLNNFYNELDLDDKNKYRDSINDVLKVLNNDAKIIEIREDRLIPNTIIRKIDKIENIKKPFNKLLKLARDEKNITASILLTVIAKPNINIDELYWEILSKQQISIDAFYNAVNQLINVGLLYPAKSIGSKYCGLYAFTHLPFLDIGKNSNDANAIIRGLKPYILSLIREMFSTDERNALLLTFEKLLRHRKIDLDELQAEYGKKFPRKVLVLSNNLYPFLKVDDKDYKYIYKTASNLGDVILSVIRYSILTGNEALDEFSNIISDIISKDNQLVNNLKEDTKIVKNVLLEK